VPEPSSASIGGDLRELLTAFEEPAPSPAGGTAAAVVAAMAASLVVMVARASTEWHDGSAVAHEAALEIAERAADVVELAARTAAGGKRPLRADAEAAAILATAATRAATMLVRVNVSASRNGDSAANEQLEADAASAEARVAAAGQ